MPLKCQILSPNYRKLPSIANPMQAAEVCKEQGLGWGACSSSSKNNNLKEQFHEETVTLIPSVPYSYCNAYDVTIVDVQLCDPEIVVPSLLVILERFTKADE